jgi:peptide/nickel transport system permease protein
MRHRASAAIGGSLLGALAIMAALAAFWTPYNPISIDVRARLQPPSLIHWLGTDEFGRDVLSRAMAGASASALVAIATVAIAILAGASIGLLCGYLRGPFDRVVMIFNDALLAFPGILLALALLVVLGAGRTALILALGIAYTPPTVRVMRSAALSAREREFVEASRVIGNSELYTLVRHVLPNCLAPLIVLATSMLGWVLLSESALSFLGLGAPPPAPTWGNMLASSRPYMQSAAWLEIAPGLCIALTLLGVNLIGDALRDRLDPRLRAS